MQYITTITNVNTMHHITTITNVNTMHLITTITTVNTIHHITTITTVTIQYIYLHSETTKNGCFHKSPSKKGLWRGNLNIFEKLDM